MASSVHYVTGFGIESNLLYTSEVIANSQIGSQRFIRGVKVRSLSHLIFTRVDSVISIWKVWASEAYSRLWRSSSWTLLPSPRSRNLTINPGPLPSRRHEALCNGRPVCKEKPEDTQTQLHPRCFMKGGLLWKYCANCHVVICSLPLRCFHECTRMRHIFQQANCKFKANDGCWSSAAGYGSLCLSLALSAYVSISTYMHT